MPSLQPSLQLQVRGEVEVEIEVEVQPARMSPLKADGGQGLVGSGGEDESIES